MACDSLFRELVDFKGVGAMGLRNGVLLEEGLRGLMMPFSVESIDVTEGGLFNIDLSPESILEDTFDKSSLREALKTLLNDSDFVKSDLELLSWFKSDFDDLSEVCEGVLERGEGHGEDETLESEGVLGRYEEAGVLGVTGPYTLDCDNLPNIGNL